MLEGSVRKAGNRVRITAQLIDGAKGDHVWADALRPRPHGHLRHPGRDLEGDRRRAAGQAAAEGKEAIENRGHLERRGLQPLPDGAAAMDQRELYGDPRRDEAIVRLCEQAHRSIPIMRRPGR